MHLFIANARTAKGTFIEITVARAAAIKNGRPAVMLQFSATLMAWPEMWRGPQKDNLERLTAQLDALEEFADDTPAERLRLVSNAQWLMDQLGHWKLHATWHTGDDAYRNRRTIGIRPN